jgi:hypothetical protein
MRYEDVQVEMAGERVKKGVEGAFIPPPPAPRVEPLRL